MLTYQLSTTLQFQQPNSTLGPPTVSQVQEALSKLSQQELVQLMVQGLSLGQQPQDTLSGLGSSEPVNSQAAT